jgi:hypothetical protein
MYLFHATKMAAVPASGSHRLELRLEHVSKQRIQHSAKHGTGYAHVCFEDSMETNQDPENMAMNNQETLHDFCGSPSASGPERLLNHAQNMTDEAEHVKLVPEHLDASKMPRTYQPSGEGVIFDSLCSHVCLICVPR